MGYHIVYIYIHIVYLYLGFQSTLLQKKLSCRFVADMLRMFVLRMFGFKDNDGKFGTGRFGCPQSDKLVYYPSNYGYKHHKSC